MNEKLDTDNFIRVSLAYEVADPHHSDLSLESTGKQALGILLARVGSVHRVNHVKNRFHSSNFLSWTYLIALQDDMIFLQRSIVAIHRLTYRELDDGHGNFGYAFLS